MAECTVELPPWRVDVVSLSATNTLIWEPQWHPVTGVGAADFLVDGRNRTLGGGAGIELKPAIQLAAVRTDRPDAGGAISNGSVITANGVTHFRETVSGGAYFWFRRGLSHNLSAGAYARMEVLMYTSFRSCAKMFPAREIVFNPLNPTNAVSYFQLTGPIPTIGVSKAKAAIIIMDNANSDMDCRIAGRAFNDPMARGGWTGLEADWSTPGTGDSAINTNEIDLDGLSLSSYQWFELALAVRKGATEDAPGRAIFHIIPAVKF